MHWFGGDGAKYFIANPAFDMLFFSVFAKGVLIKAGVNFTTHGTITDIKYKDFSIPEGASLNFSELHLSGGYGFSLNERIIAAPYLGISRVFNNLSADEASNLGINPEFPNMNALKYGISTYFNVQSSEKVQDIYYWAYSFISLDFSIENYNLKHLGVPKNVNKYFCMIGISGMFGRKDKLKIK